MQMRNIYCLLKNKRFAAYTKDLILVHVVHEIVHIFKLRFEHFLLSPCIPKYVQTDERTINLAKRKARLDSHHVTRVQLFFQCRRCTLYSIDEQ
jgi:hypothetical protein